MRTACIIALSACLAGPALSGGGPGSSFGEALRVPGTAWAMGMGGAMAASGTGVSAVMMNPAGVLDTGLTTVHLTHAFHVTGLAGDTLAFAQRLPLKAAFGASVNGLYDRSTTRTAEDEYGNYAGEAGTYPLGFMVGGAAYAKDLSAILPFLRDMHPTGGAGLRGLWQQVDTERWLGLTVDAGFRLKPGAGIILAGMLQNAGSVHGTPGLPMQWVTGLAWEGNRLVAAEDQLLIEVDPVLAVDHAFEANLGAEYRVRMGGVSLAARGGWKQENQIIGTSGATGGIGFRWTSGRLPWGLDYAYVPWGAMGNVHAISLTVAIVPPPPVEEPVPLPTEVPVFEPKAETPDNLRVFYPLKGERVFFPVTIQEPTEVSAVLQDEGGNVIATLMAPTVLQPGSHTIIWDGRRLANVEGSYVQFDMTYRILVQVGGEARYLNVIPRE